jgi:Fic family protein
MIKKQNNGIFMFEPNFNYTDRIVKNLTFIAESRAIVMGAPLVPNWEVSLRKEAILRSAHSSTAIEGNPLTFEEVSALANGRDVMARRKDKEEVMNYLEALKRIPDFSSRNPFMPKDLLEIHKILTKGTLDNPDDEGILRNRQVYVGRANGEVVFMPPTTEDVPELIDEFMEWFNSPDLDTIDPVIVAGLTHYELVRIHPFIDGNGRTARIMATIVLYKRGFDLKRFFALDDYYDHDRPGYYAALKSVNQDTLDLTEWLEYFTEGVAVSMKTVKEKVLGLSKSAKFLEEKGQIALNDRQIAIVERIISEGQITNRDIRSMFGISDTAARTEISKLMELEVLKRIGQGRSIRYVLT